MTSLLHKSITDAILKVYYEVYNELGYGFLEKVYQNAMYFELKSLGYKVEAQKQLKLVLQCVVDTKQMYKMKEVIYTLIGTVNAVIKSHKADALSIFGKGKDFEDKYWRALIRQALVAGYLSKDIETYGVIKITEKGLDYIKNPVSFMMSEDHDHEENADEDVITAGKSSGSSDEVLVGMLKELRKKVAKKQAVPPFVVFQDPSLEDMALKYPITIDELSNVHGVGEGKAKKFGAEFVALIARYVEDNDIVRPDDLVVKSTGANSGLKLFIIQSIDRKLSLPDIAKTKGLSMDDLIKEMENIVYSGTKLNIKYWLDEMLDEEQQEEIHQYFMEAETDDIVVAVKEFDGDYEFDEIRLMRIHFISSVGN